MKRRDLLAGVLAGAATAGLAGGASAQTVSPADDRQYMTGLLSRMAAPVLGPMSRGRLQQTFKPAVSPTWDGRNIKVAYLECFARLMSGLAPWLSLPADTTAEGKARAEFTTQALQAFEHSVDPKSPDYLLWQSHGQALVDSAYYTNALLRAPKQLWDPLSATTKTRIVKEIKAQRAVSPPYTNWLLFAAMNEAFLLSIGEDWDPMRIDLAVKKMSEWYVGDGWLADGTRFHFDYYNAFVMWPMLLEILEVLAAKGAVFNNLKPAAELEIVTKRTQRFAENLERMISPEATFPPIGRSLTYRTAAFQPLGLLAWRKQLPASLPEGQVRAALTAVQRRIFADRSNFDSEGYLTIGFAGKQPELGDWYSNSGSMYIASESFLSLGLAATDSYWTSPALPWTTKKAYANERFPKDYYVSY